MNTVIMCVWAGVDDLNNAVSAPSCQNKHQIPSPSFKYKKLSVYLVVKLCSSYPRCAAEGSTAFCQSVNVSLYIRNRISVFFQLIICDFFDHLHGKESKADGN